MTVNKSHFLTFILLILCSAILNGKAFSADIEDAMHAIREGDFAEAYCMLRPLADAGDAEAQYNIGWMYLNGYGLAINDSLALDWWQKSSVQGYTEASFSLAMLYSLGEGQVKRNTDLALDYYLIAIDDGHEDAVLIVKSMLLRNDKSIRQRAPDIMRNYATVLSVKRQIRVKRANIRKGAGLEHRIVKVLNQGDVVLELRTRGKWSQIIVSDDKISHWVFSALLEAYSEVENEVLD